MDFTFADKKLRRIYVERRFNAKMPVGVVSAFRELMDTIRDANDERVFYALKSIHFEKMRGDRSHQHSMRLNEQFRLVVELVDMDSGKRQIQIIGIEDYH